MRLRRRMIAVMLAALMILGTVGCGKNTGNTDSTAAADSKAAAETTEAEVDVKNVTFEQDPDVSFDGEMHFMSIRKIGDDLVYASYAVDEIPEDMIGADAATVQDAAAAQDAATAQDAVYDIEELMLSGRVYVKPISGGEEKMIYESPEGVSVDNILDANGNIGIITNDGNKKSLVTIDKDGKELSSVSLSEIDKNAKDEYIYSISVTEGGEIAVVTDKNLILLDKNGKVITTKAFSGWGGASVVTKDGKLVIVSQEMASGTKAVIHDPKTGEEKESFTLGASYISGDSIQTGFGDYDFFYKGDDGLFGYKINERTAEQLCSFNASLIDTTNIMGVVVVDNEHFIINSFGMGGADPITAYRKVDPSNVKEVKTLKLAAIYSNIDLKQNVTDFNKSHPDVRIELKTYEDEEDPFLKLSADIAAGNVPDLYEVSMGLGDISVEEAVEKNMIEDLTPYMEKDPDISESDFIESVLDSTKINGRLYYLTSSFELMTVLAKKSELGDKNGWTVEEMMDYIHSKPDDVRLFENDNREMTLTMLLYNCTGDFVDWEKGECDFESQEFKDLLEFTRKGSDEEPQWSDDFVEDLRSGKELLYPESVTPEKWNLHKVFFGEDVTCIGFPNKDRNIVSPILYGGLAISTTCQDKDTAWEFVKFCVSKEQEGKNYISAVGMPTRKDVFEAYMTSKSATEEYTDEFGNEIWPNDGGTYQVGSIVADIKPLTEEEEQEFRNLVDSITPVGFQDDMIVQIVLEEARQYYSGDKSLDETCSMIQNRVTTYINESR